MISTTETKREHIAPDCHRCRGRLDDPSVNLVWTDGELGFHPSCSEEVGLSLLKSAEQARRRQRVVVVAVGEQRPAPSLRPQLRPVA